MIRGIKFVLLMGVMSIGLNLSVINTASAEGNPLKKILNNFGAPHDSHVVYDHHGYDSHGYDRHGFNRHGFNRHGYNRHGFNRHGFNKHGYNRHGYNRFGYNMHGHYNGRFDKSHGGHNNTHYSSGH